MNSLPDRICWFLATTGGLGAIPKAPGTFGTLSGVFCAAMALGFVPLSAQTAVLSLLLLVVCVVNVMLGPWCERYFGGKDPQSVTIDELAGYLLTCLLAPRGVSLGMVLVVAFVAFRFFDILKLPPAKQAEKLPQGWGVLLDDLVAGVYAGLTVRLFFTFFASI